MSNSNSTDSNERFPPVSSVMLMESLFSHSRRLIANSLEKHNVDLPLLRTKQALRTHTQWQLDEGIIDPNRLIAALIELEGWGRQQVYLYKWKGGSSLRNNWLDRQWVKSKFEASDLNHVYNRTRPFTAKDDTALFSIEHPRRGDTIRFVWSQYRTTVRPAEEFDPKRPAYELSPDGTSWQRTILRAHIETIVRDVTTFEWNIKSCEAMLMIRKLKNTDYVSARDTIESEISDVLPIEDFDRVRMSKVIDDLDDINDVIIPRVGYRPLSNPNIRMTFAGGYSDDVLSDPKIQKIRQEHKGDFNGYGGFSKWKVGKKKWVGIDLYARKERDHRIGIRSEELEKDVRCVLQRIRAHC